MFDPRSPFQQARKFTRRIGKEFPLTEIQAILSLCAFFFFALGR